MSSLPPNPSVYVCIYIESTQDATVLVAKKNQRMKWLKKMESREEITNNPGGHVFPGGGFHEELSKPVLDVSNETHFIQAAAREFGEETGMQLIEDEKQGVEGIFLPVIKEMIKIDGYYIKKYPDSGYPSHAALFVKLKNTQDLKKVSKEFQNIHRHDEKAYENYKKSNKKPSEQEIPDLLTRDDELDKFNFYSQSNAKILFLKNSKKKGASDWFLEILKTIDNIRTLLQKPVPKMNTNLSSTQGRSEATSVPKAEVSLALHKPESQLDSSLSSKRVDSGSGSPSSSATRSEKKAEQESSNSGSGDTNNFSMNWSSATSELSDLQHQESGKTTSESLPGFKQHRKKSSQLMKRPSVTDSDNPRKTSDKKTKFDS